MPTGRLFGWAAMLVALCLTTAHLPKTRVKADAMKGRSYPQGWAEIRQLDSWNPAHFRVWGDGSRDRGAGVYEGFGWFCYRTFVDPGPMPTILRSQASSPVSDEVHGYFSELAQACQQDQSFGNALRLLFENIHLFGRSVPWSDLSISELKPLSGDERRSLREVAHAMHRVVSSPTANAEVKTATRLIVALTSGNDFAYDAVDTHDLARLPLRHPKERLTSFVSQYYLFRALLRRSKKDEALQVARRAVREYGTDRALRDLRAYQGLRDWAADVADKDNKPPSTRCKQQMGS